MIRPKNPRRRKFILLLVVPAILVPLVCVSLFLWQPLWLFHRRDLRDGNVVVEHVESFRREQGRLPNSLEELGIQGLSDQLYYQKVDAKNYQVWFSIALGESEVYDSSTGQWR
jgi:hypothetical protein